MTLNDWLEAEGKGAKTWLAREIDVRWQTVHDIARGVSRPQLETALAIERATGGQVTVRDLCPARMESA